MRTKLVCLLLIHAFCLGAKFLINLPNVDGSVLSPPSRHMAHGRRNRKRLFNLWHQTKSFDNDGDWPISLSTWPEDCRHFAIATVLLGWKQGTVVLVAGVAVIRLHQILNAESVKRATYFWLHAGPVVAHYKFAKWWLTKTNASLEKRNRVYDSLHDNYCNQALQIAFHLKGLYVKLAQVVSSRPDFVPPQYIDLFVAAQDSLPQCPIEEVVAIVNQSLRSEYGLSFEDVFESMDAEALGSASIGQCHRAKLREPYAHQGDYSGGDIAAVKVMHPGAEGRFQHDFQVFRWLCKLALTGWEPILDECYRQIMSEFDYRREAESLATIRQIMSKSPFKGRIRVPDPLHSVCTKEILVMEMLDGKKLSDSLEDELAVALGRDHALARSFIKTKRLELILGQDKLDRLGMINGATASKSFGWMTKLRLVLLHLRAQKQINLLIDVQGYQMLHAGVFQGDPHPGNVLKLRDGQLGLIDYGQTKYINADERRRISGIVQALANGASAEVISKAMREFGFRTKLDDDDVLAKYAALFFDSDMEGKKMGCATPQSYFKVLTEADPLVQVPDVAVFVARSSFILRGMGTLLDKQIQTSMRWKVYADEELKRV